MTVAEIIELSKAQLARQLHWSKARIVLEDRLDELLTVLEDRDCLETVAEILKIRDAIWRLDADNAVHHRNHELAGPHLRPSDGDA